MKKKFFALVALLIGIVAMFIPKQTSVSTKELANHFYSFYYASISRDKTTEETASLLKNYNDTGFSTSMEEALKILTPEEQLKVIEATKCNLTESTFTFFPKAPYDAIDYDYTIKMSCPK